MQVMSLRRIERQIGISRLWLGNAVRCGDLPAVRRGPALLVDLDDLRDWWQAQAASRLGSPGEPRP